MKEPTKADLAAAVAKLTEENAGLRDLLAAVSECARSVPQAAAGDHRRQLDRATHTLIVLGVVTDPDSTWTWGWGSGQGAARGDPECGHSDHYAHDEPMPSAFVTEISGVPVSAAFRMVAS